MGNIPQDARRVNEKLIPKFGNPMARAQRAADRERRRKRPRKKPKPSARFLVEIESASNGDILDRRSFLTFQLARRHMLVATANTCNGARMFWRRPNGEWLLMDEPRLNTLPLRNRTRPTLQLIRGGKR